MRALTDSWELGGLRIANRLVLAPLAGIGNWFVRLQARRHGAGLVVSEMVSSFGLAYGNQRTVREFLRIHPEEHPVSVQLFGHDAEIMREAATMVAAAGADLIDLNMGCPVPKVCKTGAGAALLDDPGKAVAIARAAVEGSGVPVTVKLRPGRRPGDRAGVDLARRLADEAGVAGIAFHPRHASQQHKGSPDYDLARELVEALEVPVLLSGGISSDERAVKAFERSGAEALMLARGSLGNPWRFERLRKALRRAQRRRGPRRAALDDRELRGAPGHRARRPLAAQGIPLVRGAAGPAEAAQAAARDGPNHPRGARRDRAHQERSARCARRLTAMAQLAELDLPEFDYYSDAELRGQRFHDVMADLRERSWLASSDLATFVLDREAASYFLRTKSATFPGMKIAEMFGIDDGPLFEEMKRNILHLNGEHHRRLRNLVNPAFTPRAADRWRPAMRGFVEQLWEAVKADGRCDFVEAFAKPYPALTIATVMGAPLEDAPRLHEWSLWIQRQFDVPSLMTERERIERAVEEFYEYAGALLEKRRSSPSDDLISTLIEAEAEGDRLSDVELVNLVLNVLIGGVDTTQSQLAQGIRLFAEHPDQWELLAERPELTEAAVDEVVRYEPITPFTARILLEDVEYRDVTFPKDTVLMVSAVTANREPDAHDFDITAERADAKLLTFGAGIHYCLGANLAKAELQEALAFLAPRMRGLALDGDPVFGSVHGIYGLDALPIRFESA